ncbi:MAG: phosphopantothenoylcysteine decarboxylase, partial [Candidatus Thermoplasmatota archaeon]|nr:phosphopantothenoylcysteine decarboxylase [Candidatus Thermoplasmatota archaeon]
SKIIGFKVEGSKDSVKTKSLELLNKNKLDFVVGNTTSGFGADENEIWVFGSKGNIIHKNGTKDYLADCILDLIKE